MECVSVFVGVSIAMQVYMIRRNLGRQALTWLTLPFHSPSLEEVGAGTQGRTLEAGTKTETIEEECRWLTPPELLILLLLHKPGPSAQGGTAYSGLGPPPSTVSPENGPQTYPQATGWRQSLPRGPSFV